MAELTADTGENQPEKLRQLVSDTESREATSTGKIFQFLLPVQWVFVLLISLLVTPQTWIGSTSSVKVHVYAAVVLGGLLTIFPLFLIRWNAAAHLTRHTIAIAQLLYSGLIIHVTGGQIESHFHIFASLALIAFYRDWRVIATATAVTGIDHLVRGLFAPLSIFGISTGSLSLVLIHVGWVVFMDVFLLIWVSGQVRAMWEDARKEIALRELQKRTEGVLGQAVEHLQLATDLTAGADEALQQIERIGESTTRVSGVSQELQEAIVATETGSEQVAEGVSSLEESAEQQSSAVEDTAREIGEVVDSAERVSEVSSAEIERIAEVQRDTDQVVSNVHESVELMRNLGQAGSQIVSIIEVIRDVAGRTQLLALNAAIEAAHAGEYGKGFAVVAGEIRKLSDQASNQAAQVEEQVGKIVDGLRRADEYGTTVETGISHISDNMATTREAFESIDERIIQVKERATRISEVGGELRRSAQLVREAAHRTKEFQSHLRDTFSSVDRLAQEIGSQAGVIGDNVTKVGETVQQTASFAQNLNVRLASMQRDEVA
jgi:methyl-accepting chemotaxis protein